MELTLWTAERERAAFLNWEERLLLHEEMLEAVRRREEEARLEQEGAQRRAEELRRERVEALAERERILAAM